MTSGSNDLIWLLSLVDRPDCEMIVGRAKRAALIPKIVRPLSAAAITYLLVATLGGMGSQAITIAAIVGGGVALVSFINDVLPAAERHQNTIAKASGGLGLFIGVAIALMDKKEMWITLAAGVGGFVAMWLIAQFGLLLLTLLVSLANTVLRALASPIAVPVLAFVAWLNNRAVRDSGWKTSNGMPIAVFNRDGLKNVYHANEPIFVSSPVLRAGGTALAAGIPLFTYTELLNSSFVTQRMEEAYDSVAMAGVEAGAPIDHPLMTFAEINPATGLPMMDGVGSLDVMGNPYGFTDQYFHADPGMQNSGLDHHY